MMRITILVWLFPVVIAFGQTQQIDSLLSILPETKGEERVELLHSLVRALWTSEPNTAVHYGQEAIALSKELGDLKLESISYRLFGGLYNYMSLIDSGRYYKFEALRIAHQLNDSLLLAPSYNNLGVTAHTIGNYVEALDYYYRAYQIASNLSQFENLSTLLANISEAYYDLTEYDSAILYAKEAVISTAYNPNTSRHLLAKIGLARANQANGNHTDAKELFLSIVEIGETIGEKRYTSYAYQGLGRLSTYEGNKEAALKYFSLALNLFLELDDQTYIAEIYWELSNVYKTQKPDSAIHFMTKSLAIAQSLSLNDIILDNYENLIDLFGKNGPIDSLQQYLLKYKELEAAQRRENNLKSIEGMFAKIQDEQMRNRLADQSIKLERKTFQTNFMLALALITLVFAGIMFSYYRKQKRLGNHLTEVNEMLAHQSDLIAKQNEDLKALNQEKNSLINIVAHDLKNPLSHITGIAQLIKDGFSKGEKMDHKLLQMIEGSASRLTNMISKILNVESIERRLSNVELVPVNLSEIVDTVSREFEHQANVKQIGMLMNISDDLVVMGGQTYMPQVIQNLLSNAIKFSPPNKNVHINLSKQNGLALLEVRDEGPGITQDDQALLFQKFQTLSAVPTSNETSTGLGLSIVKKFVEAMNGKIWCESEEGQGASFFAQFQFVRHDDQK